MKTLVISLLLPVTMWAADAAPVPPDVLAQAAQVAAAAKQKAAAAANPPSAEALKIADQLDVLLLTSRVLLDQQEPTKAGDRFINAVKVMQDLPRADRKALGERYLEQRRQLMELAQRLLADPAVAAALNDKPLAPPAADVVPVESPKTETNQAETPAVEAPTPR